LPGEPKTLDCKTGELIAFSRAVAVRGEFCAKVHLHEAKKTGATKEELFEKFMIGGLMA